MMIKISRDNLDARITLVNELLKDTGLAHEAIRSSLTVDEVKGKIENFIGAIPIPLGLSGPIEVHGQHAQGTFVVPMATLEGTLLASYSRGAKLMNLCGGCETVVYDDYFLRAAGFIMKSLADGTKLIDWCKEHEGRIREIIKASDPYISLIDMSYDRVGTTVIVSIRLDTGDAMGSNMASKASAVIFNYVRENYQQIQIQDVILPYPEDKKYIPSRQKGKKVIAKCVLEREAYLRITRTTLEKLKTFIDAYKDLLALHGGYSLNVHAANGMAALFQAFGQDMAYIGECSQVIVSARFVDANHLEVSITSPTLIIGTVGGGTGLPAFRTTLSMVGCYGPGKAKKLAEIIAAVILAGEIGCSSAQCAQEFVRAHETMGKNPPKDIEPLRVHTDSIKTGGSPQISSTISGKSLEKRESLKSRELPPDWDLRWNW